MAIVLLLDHHPNLITKLNDYLLTKYNITNASISTRFIRDLPRDADGYTLHHLNERCITDYYPLKDVAEYIDDITDVSLIGDVIASDYIQPVGTWTDDLSIAKQWLTGIESTYDTIAVDFEAKDLTIPQFNKLTMVTIGWNLTKSIVIVFKDEEITNYVLNWLVTTECRQVYHNALYDTRLIHYYTGKLPKHIEDSQLLVAVYKNHVDESKRKSGLKELAKYPYKDWASDKSSFELYVDSSSYVNPNLHYVGSNPTPWMYNLPLIYYASIDSMATKFVWDKFSTEPAYPDHWIFQTSEPRYNTEQFNQRYYYDFILKPAIPVIVEMLNNGQPIDLEQVKELSDKVETIKQQCLDKINEFDLIKQFQAPIDQARIDKFLEPVLKAWKHPDYSKGYQSNPKMRAYVVNHITGSTFDTLSDKQLKDLANPLLQPLIDKQFDHPDIVAACNAYHEAEALRQNENMNRVDKVNNPQNYVQIGFNPYNYQQLAKMWIDFGLESDEVSKTTGEQSFSSTVLKSLAKTIPEGDVKSIIKLYLEIAESKNMITQYIPKYFGSTINNRVFGSIRLMGTISGRLSGKAAKMDGPEKHMTGINLVTQPASSSAFAKPVKKLFKAPKGKLLVQIDYSNLEGNVGAILTHDETSVRNLKQDFDTHVLHSAAYWTPEWEELSGIKFDKTSLEVNKQYKALCDTNPRAKTLRTNSKGVSFGLSYGAYPPKVAKSIGCSLAEATTIFDNFHNLLYPGVTEYREKYVMPQVATHGWIHLNYGLKLFSDNAKKDIRTLNNSTMQGYSNVTQISGVEFDRVYKQSQYVDDIKLINIVHDCLYYEVTDDINVIKYINDTLPPIMCRPFVHDQALTLKAEIDIGPNLAETVTLPNNADLATIIDKLSTLK